MKFHFVLLLAPLISSFVFGAPQISLSIKDAKSSKTKSITLQTKTDHHFNKDAPNKVEAKSGEKWISAEKYSFNGSLLNIQFADAVEGCQVRGRVFVCDNKNTYCLPAKLDLNECAKKSHADADAGEAASASAAAASLRLFHTGEKAQKVSENLFITNDPDKALEMAKKDQKPLLIDFFGIWCPPCNQMDETVFSRPDFEKLAAHFVLLKLDADSEKSWPLKSKYKVTGYPTFVFATPDGNEMGRVVGSRSPEVFLAAMDNIVKMRGEYKDVSDLQTEADHSPEAAYRLGQIYLDKEDYHAAHYYLSKASKVWKRQDPREDKLLTATLGLYAQSSEENGKRIYLKALKDALIQFPHSDQVLGRLNNLEKVAEALGDKSESKQALQDTVKAAQWFLVHPSKAKQIDYSPADLLEAIAETYVSLDEKEKAVLAYKSAADTYLKQIRESGQDEGLERGFNLERIYCIWKSGDTELAKQLYEKMEAAYPDEFTFYLTHAKLLQSLKEYDKATEKADKAVRLSYGDNHLRAVAMKAELLDEMKQKKQALTLLDQTLKQSPLPDDKTIRTHRYVDQLKKLKDKIQAEGA